MKKHLLVLLLTVITIVGYAQSRNYGPWYTAVCFKGIEYRVSKGQYNEYAKEYKWYVQFRNNYNQEISFSFEGSPDNTSNIKTNKRCSIEPGEIHLSEMLIGEANSITVTIDKLTFNSTRNGKYEPCDL